MTCRTNNKEIFRILWFALARVIILSFDFEVWEWDKGSSHSCTWFGKQGFAHAQQSPNLYTLLVLIHLSPIKTTKLLSS
jgi:hypothetical protein